MQRVVMKWTLRGVFKHPDPPLDVPLLLMYVLLIWLNMYTHGHMQKYTCTYESINNFKLSAFLLKIVYTVCGVRLCVLCLS